MASQERLLQHVLDRLEMSPAANCDLPDEDQFPLNSLDELDAFEAKLARDDVTKKQLVSWFQVILK